MHRAPFRRTALATAVAAAFSAPAAHATVVQETGDVLFGARNDTVATAQRIDASGLRTGDVLEVQGTIDEYAYQEFRYDQKIRAELRPGQGTLLTIHGAQPNAQVAVHIDNTPDNGIARSNARDGGAGPDIVLLEETSYGASSRKWRIPSFDFIGNDDSAGTFLTTDANGSAQVVVAGNDTYDNLVAARNHLKDNGFGSRDKPVDYISNLSGHGEQGAFDAYVSYDPQGPWEIAERISDVDFFTFENLEPGALFEVRHEPSDEYKDFLDSGLRQYTQEYYASRFAGGNLGFEHGRLGAFDESGALVGGDEGVAFASDGREAGSGYASFVGIVPENGELTVAFANGQNREFTAKHWSSFRTDEYAVALELLDAATSPAVLLPDNCEVGNCPDGFFEFNIRVTDENQTFLIDPPVVAGYDYVSDLPFSSLVLPGLGDGIFEVTYVDADGNEITREVTAGERLEFGGDGVEIFSVRGIEPDLGLDPSDPQAFVAAVQFAGRGSANVRQTPFTVEFAGDVAGAVTVPEPAGLSLGLLALGAGFAARRRAT